jgi:intracellular septation protein A
MTEREFSGSSVRRNEMVALAHAIRPVVIDLAATLFFYAVLALTGDAPLAAAAGILLGLAQAGLMRLRGIPIALLQWISLGLVVVLGTMTIMTHDPRFVIVKVTIVYLAVGAGMLRPGWMRRYIPRIADGHIPPSLITGFEYGWAALIIGTGLLNLGLTIMTSARMVASVMTIWAPASKLALFAVQYLLMRAIARPSIRAARLSKGETA